MAFAEWALVPYEVSYLLRCSVCVVTQAWRFEIAAGMQEPMLMFPEGWSMVDGKPVCPEHVVRVDPTLVTSEEAGR